MLKFVLTYASIEYANIENEGKTMTYYPAFICTNGHVISASSIDCYDKYCSLCGAPVISACPDCLSTIKGHEYGCSGHFLVPAYCQNCGSPYPWTSSAIRATAQLLAEDELLTADECNNLVDVLPDVITETPRSKLAAARIGKALKVAGRFTADALRQFILDFGCEIVKRQLGL